MKLISWNVNGIRSAYQKGFLKFVAQENPDILCLQEIKAQENDLPQELLTITGYTLFINSAQKKGYSGVAVYTKTKPKSVKTVFGQERFDQEGRFLELEFPGFTLINIYIPHGGREKENLGYKLDAYHQLFRYLEKIKAKNLVLMGDFNIAHMDIDLAKPRENRDNIMFTPEERKQLDTLLALGFVDSFRHNNKATGNYSWWPYAFDARNRNLGWRIDYGFVSKGLAPDLEDAKILPNVLGSDHCPIGLELSNN
jgi:exodeoxyribonuclease-3